MRCLFLAVLSLALLPPPVGGDDRPIPQDPARQQQRDRDRLAWNRKTLGGAYDRVGRKDSRWDQPARAALEGAARLFSREADSPVTLEEVHGAARRAIEAGCDGFLICGGDVELQASALETVVHAVESGRITRTHLDDALARQRRAKERFLTVSVKPDRVSAVRAVIGSDAHRSIADEMARYL